MVDDVHPGDLFPDIPAQKHTGCPIETAYSITDTETAPSSVLVGWRALSRFLEQSCSSAGSFSAGIDEGDIGPHYLGDDLA